MGRASSATAWRPMVSAPSGTGVTTYAENIIGDGRHQVRRLAMFVVAALIAVLLGFTPVRPLIQAIPPGR